MKLRQKRSAVGPPPTTAEVDVPEGTNKAVKTRRWAKAANPSEEASDLPGPLTFEQGPTSAPSGGAACGAAGTAAAGAVAGMAAAGTAAGAAAGTGTGTAAGAAAESAVAAFTVPSALPVHEEIYSSGRGRRHDLVVDLGSVGIGWRPLLLAFPTSPSRGEEHACTKP